eukprot:Hpha_TRINITY_DN16892_c0_g1::TRINITY_DN16892_c0_g1_i18::g.150064::m.150064
MGNMKFVISVSGLFVSAVSQQERRQHATTPSVAGGAPLKRLGTCSDEEQALNLMLFARNITPLPDGWGTLPLCGGTWRGITCNNGCVTEINLQDFGLSGTPNLSTLPSGLQ